MAAVGPLLGILLVVGLLAVIMYAFSAGTASRALNQQEREELTRLRDLVDDLKETAWDHRELDSPLATIIIDKIRNSGRRGRGSR
ncbi:MAG TPA: hypothetical protein VF165_22500 [Nocardioidaceae bacterium]